MSTYYLAAMTKKIIFLFFLFIFQFAKSQNKTIISGKITYQEIGIPKAEVVNITQKKDSQTDLQGKFKIQANKGDTLLFFSKNFKIQKIILTEAEIYNSELIIILELESKELEEIVINKGIRWSAKEIQKILDTKYVDDLQTSPKNKLIYDGTIENGVDIARIGKELYRLIKKGLKQKNNSEEVSFNKHVLKTCDLYYFKNQLGLNEDNIVLFLEYCSMDSKSKIVQQKNNVFDTMDFLSSKINDFKKEYEIK